jgi:hypothetical protein
MSDQDENLPEETTDAGADRADVETTEGEGQLGDAGKKALDAMKAKWQKERDARKALEDQIAKTNSKDEGDKPDADKIREQAKAEARAEVLRDRALDKVETKAAKLFTDPEDARALLASHVDDFIDGGRIDVDAITEALEELLKKKPHLAATAPKRFQGSADSGARNGSKVTQVSEQDLKRMTPEQIVKAREEGRLADLL